MGDGGGYRTVGLAVARGFSRRRLGQAHFDSDIAAGIGQLSQTIAQVVDRHEVARSGIQATREVVRRSCGARLVTAIPSRRRRLSVVVRFDLEGAILERFPRRLPAVQQPARRPATARWCYRRPRESEGGAPAGCVVHRAGSGRR